MSMQRGKHAAWERSDAEALLTLMMQQLQHFAVVFTDVQGQISGWSEGAHFITGFSADDIIGKHIAMLFTPEDVDRKLDVHEMNSAQLLGAAEDERWHMRKDGSRFWASGVMLPLRRDGVLQGFVKLFRDATHLRSRMKSLENEVQQFTKERAERNMFLATTAHELRNPLQAMKVAKRLLSQPCDDDRRDHAVKILDRQLVFAERMVEDLVDMTRVSEGKMSLLYEKCELQSLLLDAIEVSRDAAKAKSISLLPVFPLMPIEVEVDPARTQQVIVNLLNNALKFTPMGGHVSVQANVDQTHFMVLVKDNGIGISAELQPKIFDMFTQAERAGTRRGDGLGIGLALVKEIVTLHQGTSEVRSEGVGKGSEFVVRMPLRRPRGSEPEPRPETPRASGS